MKTLTFPLTPELEAFVDELMQTGRYANEEEVLAEALREHKHDRELLKAEVKKGLDEIERGEYSDWSLDEFLQEAKAFNVDDAAV